MFKSLTSMLRSQYIYKYCTDIISFHFFKIAFFTSEEVFLSIDEMVRGLVHLDLTLPRLGHVPHLGVARYHVELSQDRNTLSQSEVY